MYRFFITSLVCFLILLISGCKADIEIIYQDVEVIYADPKYFADPDIYLNDATSVFINITLVDHLPITSEIKFELIAATMGEFIVPTGIDVQRTMCEVMNEPIIIAGVLESMGFEENQCPPEPGVYGSPAFYPDLTLLPETFRANNYVAVFEVRDQGEQLFEVRIYSHVA